MSESTKKYVVVFDELHKATGELTPGSPGSPPLQVVSVHHRGDTVELDAETAKRHLEVGAVIAADDKRAKLIEPNPALSGGVKRDPQVPVELDQTAPAIAGGEGAKRGDGTDFANMKVGELKAAAAQHGIEVGARDNKATLVKKLQASAAGDAELRAGQGKDESPPPEHQPDEPPAK